MIIDSHIHLLPKRVRWNREHFCKDDPAFGAVFCSPKARMATEQQIIDYLDEGQIDKAVVFGFPWEDRKLIKVNNDEVWDFHDRFPDRIIPFAVLSPRAEDSTYREADRALNNGFAGIGELAMYHGGWSLSDFEALHPVLCSAATAKTPVLIHVNEPVGHHYPGKSPVDFRGLLHIIETHQDVDFILAHWGGGVFVYALMPEVRRVMSRTYLDTAASPFLYSPEVYRAASLIVGQDKILFGSDYPLLPIARYLKEIESAGIDGATREAILGGNAERLLGLAGTSGDS
jgi:uncharacterized protein